MRCLKETAIGSGVSGMTDKRFCGRCQDRTTHVIRAADFKVQAFGLNAPRIHPHHD